MEMELMEMVNVLLGWFAPVVAWARQWSAGEWLQAAGVFGMLALVAWLIVMLLRAERTIENILIQYDTSDLEWREKVEDIWKYNSNLKRSYNGLKAECEQWMECSRANEANAKDYHNLYTQAVNVLYELQRDMYLICKRDEAGHFAGKITIDELLDKFDLDKTA